MKRETRSFNDSHRSWWLGFLLTVGVDAVEQWMTSGGGAPFQDGHHRNPANLSWTSSRKPRQITRRRLGQKKMGYPLWDKAQVMPAGYTEESVNFTSESGRRFKPLTPEWGTLRG